MRIRGFLLTTDALVALVLVLFSAGLLATVPHVPTQGYAALEALGRDYLVLNYQLNAPVNPATFLALTGFGVSESAPGISANLSVGSQAYIHPFPMEACGCTSQTCFLRASVNASCLQTQANLLLGWRSAWVTP